METPAPAAAVPAAISVGLLILLAVLLRWPPLGDVTTTPEDPPSFRVGPSAGAPYPRRYAGLQARAHPDLKPLERDVPVADAFSVAAAAAAEMDGWHVVLRDDSLAVLQAVAETRLLGFDQDVVIEVRPVADGSVVHVRSRSRTGRADFGLNARRVREYLDRLE